MFERYSIPQEFRPAFLFMIDDGQIFDAAFRDLIVNDFHFRAANEEIQERLSPNHIFLPTHFESFDLPTGESAVSTSTPLLDVFGREIKVGDTVGYPVRQGSRMWVARMRVTQVLGGTTPKIGGFNNEGRKVTVFKLDNVIVSPPLTDDEKKVAGVPV